KHLLELVNKDVKFAKLDDEDAVCVCLLLALDFVFMGHELRHVVPKPIVNLGDDFYKWDAFPWFFHKRDYNVAVTRWKFHLEKLANNPKYKANYVLSARKGSSKGKSVHTRVRTEVRHEVHVRTEVFRVHFKEEMILDLQLRLNSVEEKLKPGLPDVDHLDKSMGGVSQCMNVDDPYKNWNDVSNNFHVDGLDHKSVEGDFVDSPHVKVNDNKDAYHSDYCLSTQHVREVLDDVNVNSVVKDKIVKDDVNVDSLVKEDIEKDDVHVDSFVKEDIKKDDVQFGSVVKDVEQTKNETLPRQKFPEKAYLSPYIQPSSTEVKCRKRRREIKLERLKKVIKNFYGSDGVEIKLLPWKEDVTRSPTAPKRTVYVPEEVNALFRDKYKMEMILFHGVQTIILFISISRHN
nr:phospholipase-like protein [Tanacetum cinerariifolium]